MIQLLCPEKTDTQKGKLLYDLLKGKQYDLLLYVELHSQNYTLKQM